MSVIRYRILFFFLIVTACSDWNLDRVDFPQVQIGEAYEVGFITTSIDGIISGLVNEQATNHGHVVSSVSDLPSLADYEVITQLGVKSNGPFTSQLSGLILDTEYKVRAYVTSDEKTVYSEIVTFRTQSISVAPDTILGLPGPDIEISGRFQVPEVQISQDIILSVGIADHGIVWSEVNEDPTPVLDQVVSGGRLFDQ